MLLIPVTFLATSALGVVLVCLVMTRDLRATANRLFAGLVALYLLQSLLVSLRWGYGIDTLRLPVAAIAAVIPACAWLAWRALSGRIGWPQGWAAFPVLVIWAALVWWRDAADVLIPLAYLGFGLSILVPAVLNRDAPALTALGDARQTRHAMALIGAALIGSALTDAFIIYDFVRTGGRTAGHVLSVVQTAFILVIGTAAAFGRSTGEEATGPECSPEDMTAHVEVLDRLEALFARERLHHAEDLSLRRLSRRLGLPDRKVSEAVNRVRGVNLSQYVNEYRIRDACTLLRDSDQGILQVALAVGFASKSNFNREFQRVTGHAPSVWRAAAQQSTSPLKGPGS
jgi:AraC-like DNA-binding protein/F0F1-type ATP synthase membrane subunit c/vacuolar-type H+-ATPase subunit K